MTPTVGTAWVRTTNPDATRHWIVTAIRAGRNGSDVVTLHPDFPTMLGPLYWPCHSTRRAVAFGSAFTPAP